MQVSHPVPSSPSQGGAPGRRYCLPGLASHIHVALGLGFLPRTVLEGNTPAPASAETEFVYQKPLALILHIAEGVRYLTSGPYETGVE